MHPRFAWIAGAVVAAFCSLSAALAQSPAGLPKQDLAVFHAENVKLNCSGCHGDVSPLTVSAEASLATANQNCLNCHGDAKSLAAQIEPKLVHKEINPHASHLVQIDCVTCHSGHTAKEAYCNQCHAFDMPMPPKSAKK
jgi:fumarate reductase flavoprotein subunit